VFQFLQFPQINHRKEKKSHARQITIGHSICFVLPYMDSNLRPFTAVVRHFKLPLPRCAPSDLPNLTHLHPSFGHEHAMRVCQASPLLPSVISLAYRASRWVRAQGGPGTPSKQPSSQNALVLFTAYQKAILVDYRQKLIVDFTAWFRARTLRTRNTRPHTPNTMCGKYRLIARKRRTQIFIL
jgi:hypothetical protein